MIIVLLATSSTIVVISILWTISQLTFSELTRGDAQRLSKNKMLAIDPTPLVQSNIHTAATPPSSLGRMGGQLLPGNTFNQGHRTIERTVLLLNDAPRR